MITIWRIIKYGFQNLLRNKWLSISTVSIMILTLVVFEGVVLFNVFSTNAIEAVKDKVDISVYFRSNVAEDDVLNVKQILESFDEVKEVEYVSRDEALKRFKENHAGDEVITQTLEELDSNPLLASLNVRALELSQYDAIASYLSSASLNGMVEKVTYAQNELVIKRLESIVGGLNTAILVLTLFLAFLSVMVTFNTISLAIFSNKEQIAIMRIIGADNKFIRGPYIIEGFMYGVVGAVISIMLYIPIVSAATPALANFVPSFSLEEYFNNNIGYLLMYQLFVGAGLGVLSSVVAIRRYLKS
ncbi:MAG TPA: ABC transporter permease [Candidatus Jorgensenbacteria bacterium]|uniref:Cell division protein FtsX n=1 Tax=marine sediment metagenome TaxID=412755 RepID=A0A0F9K634_9ZZZZ|nr:ABC transporter permease [Candidatus Jorgensenbacteria bacterium]